MHVSFIFFPTVTFISFFYFNYRWFIVFNCSLIIHIELFILNLGRLLKCRSWISLNKNKNGLNKEKITCSPNKEDAYGLRFIVNGKWKNNTQRKENDTVGILQPNSSNIQEPKIYHFNTKKKELVKGLRMKRKIKNNRNLITIINCYAQHSEVTKKNQKMQIFYENIDKSVKN